MIFFLFVFWFCFLFFGFIFMVRVLVLASQAEEIQGGSRAGGAAVGVEAHAVISVKPGTSPQHQPVSLGSLK